MEITPPYYHRHHTLVYIFKNFFMKYDMKIFICFSCAITGTPNNTKPTLSGWAQGEDIIKKKVYTYWC